MYGEPPVRILRVPPQFEGQILPKRLAGHREPTHVHETKSPLLLVMPTDLADTVEITRGILPGLERSPQLVHVPAPKHRDDDAHYASLAVLGLPERREFYLGVVQHDNRDGDRRRIAAAAKTVPDFGIATEYGRGCADPARAPACSTASASPWRATITRPPIRLTHTRPSPGIPRFSRQFLPELCLLLQFAEQAPRIQAAKHTASRKSVAPTKPRSVEARGVEGARQTAKAGPFVAERRLVYPAARRVGGPRVVL